MLRRMINDYRAKSKTKQVLRQLSKGQMSSEEAFCSLYPDDASKVIRMEQEHGASSREWIQIDITRDDAKPELTVRVPLVVARWAARWSSLFANELEWSDGDKLFDYAQNAGEPLLLHVSGEDGQQIKVFAA